MSARGTFLLGSLALLTASGILVGQEAPLPSQGEQRQTSSSENAAVPKAADSADAVGDLERSALTFSSYDLSVHLRPEAASISVLARVSVRNDGIEALTQIALQVSSSLHWEGLSQRRGRRTDKLTFGQHLLQTDADHTGEVSEAVIHLAEPLAPNGTAELVLLYSGTVRRSTSRLERVGSSGVKADAVDWDLISPEGVALRGFGNILWYPVASPQVFLGEGASLRHVAGQQMLRQAAASVKLRVSVEYGGETPASVFFCGRQALLAPTSDSSDAPVANAPGIATAEFPTQQLGFRTLSLFVAGKPVPAVEGAIAVVTSDAAAPERLRTISGPITEMLAEWIGADSAHRLTVIDHAGVPFSDGDLLVTPVSGAEGSSLRSTLLPALAQAHFRSTHAWLQEGVAQFLSLLWLERTQGRQAAVAALQDASHPLALAESVAHPDVPANETLLLTSDAVYYRNKSAAVLWMLRDIIGDDVLKRVLQRYGRNPKLDQDDEEFEKLSEEVSGKKLRWFFDDWVYRDPGLPDLSILSIAPRQLSSTSGQSTGSLVAIEVRNEGAAAVEVPVTVRSGTLTATERLRVNAHSVASTRILFQGVPEQVQVNDGSVPELIESTHLREITVH